MINKIIMIFTVCFCLIGCQHLQKPQDKHTSDIAKVNIGKTPQPKRVKQLCIEKCESLYKSCQSQCKDSCRQCQQVADKQAWQNYQKYCKRMKINGTYRPRDWLSFRDPLQCRKVTCSCLADLNVCVQQCGGEIKKKLIATPYCE